jgi:branched-chain amino acid transport system ATP-binding protein
VAVPILKASWRFELLKLNNIEVIYHSVVLVLRGVSMKIPDGSVVALLGANGAGKSTTLKAISGLLHVEMGKVTEGNVYLAETRIDKKGPEDIARLGVVQVLEGRKILEHMTIEEELKVGAHMRKDTSEVKKDMEIVYGYFPKLKMLKRSTTGYLSGGEQQMVLIGRAFMARPRYMLLDEPSLGLAPILVEEIFTIIKKINEENNTGILLVEQNANAALTLAEYGYVMENGRIVLDGPSDKLRENEDVKEFYLGLSEVGKRKSFREVKHYKRRKRWL